MKSAVSSTATSIADAAESSMEDNSSDQRNLSSKSTGTLHTTSPLIPDEGNPIDGDGDPAVWATFTENFLQVQSVLDRNRVLIQQVNENHQSKVPDNMVKNVALIQEINGNISKVVSLYSDLSANFSGVFHEQSAGEKQ